ncbi:MAG: mechanosensitive ion channel family protein [Limnospira sp. PMC 894.15]|uniref:Small-conductance mechanosensitive channel n=3 Tax=Oscillatoriales TaxID=1150 RepID=A0A9P1P0V8_9CYAN|nr:MULTISPECIES: mechanosensitive ion channel family protein [Limnospira]SMZ64523.1 mechanosensitive ion channel MscS [Arthrospira sp. SRM16]MDT9190600.1 mechanosensitive ion channel family protein [Limnospira sp. PMC 894.15]MDT9236516.1 mechanosensitive ion channel family protein [Limnospira sp. PMC 917.15]MDT9277380.1 mechanosensitive ion channel family protein [Limnospira sp. PMC 737.11]CDM95240.1 Small-conductance mechanosensitive channel [Limnospira indica PCC 8005]
MNALVQEIQSSLLSLVGSAIQVIPALILAIIVLLITRFAANFVRQFLNSTAPRFVRSTSLQVLLIHTGYVLTWAGGVIIACVIAFPDLRLGDIIGLLGLSSVAIGFAFQDIFKNFLAGILLLLQEPFQIGDQIVVEDYEGTIENISIRSTQMLTYHGERVVIPNSILFTSPVQVKTAESHRRTDLAIGVDYNTPLPMAVETLLNATKTVEGVLSEPEVEVDVVGFGDSSIDLMVRYWTFPERKQVRRVTTQVMIALKQACDEADINIPYPIRTLYFFNQESYNDHYPAAANSQTN